MPTTQTSSYRSAPNSTGLDQPVRPIDREEITAFTDFCQSAGKSRKTVATYREAAGQLATFAAAKGMPVLTELRREHIEDFLGHLRGKGNKPATVRNRHAGLRALYNWMIHEDIRADHPMARVARPQIPETVQPHYREDEILRVLAAISGRARDVLTLRDRALILFLLDTGVRCQELCDIRIGAVDREARQAHVVTGKGGKGRVVAYSADVANALNSYLRKRGGWEAAGPTAPLFAMRDGSPFKTNGVRMLMQRRFAAAGVEYRGTHGFRRSAGIGFLENGGDPTDLKELMGWSSWSMLYKYTKATARSRALRAHEAHSPVARMLRQGRKP
ncbi:MAG: hypothetical protein EPO22_04035 [Dehalococcoidia bacterium]|nr:MAG: hypothetical protein EPO22_04035 [Dehalococcoidia bacterium]